MHKIVVKILGSKIISFSEVIAFKKVVNINEGKNNYSTSEDNVFAIVLVRVPL